MCAAFEVKHITSAAGKVTTISNIGHVKIENEEEYYSLSLQGNGSVVHYVIEFTQDG